MHRILCALVVFSLFAGCARDKPGDGPSLAHWSLTERRFTSLAYQAKEAADAVRVLRFLVREFEIEAKRPKPENGIHDAVWVNRLRLAAATYASGEKDQALTLIDQSVSERLQHAATPDELSSGRKDAKQWIVHDITFHHPAWGASVILDFTQ